MHIYIDDVRMDTDDRTLMSITLAITSVSDPEKNRTGYTNPIILPVTATNRKVMDSCDQIHSAGIFNHTRHTARVEKEDCIVMEGTAVLLACSSWENGSTGGYYRVGLVGAGKVWADYAASLMLRALPVEFNETLTESMIWRSWTWDNPVKFLPVQRDGFAVENHSLNLIKPKKILTFEDYHPFIHVRSILDKILDEAGYRLSSEFMDSKFFNKLYISGNYPAKSADAIKSRMDFRAGRFTSATATADSMGRVYADPYRTYSTLGNIVETANPEDISNGIKVSGVYDNGGCFLYDGERIAFIPLFEIMAAFEYRIFYTTEYYMESREELTGFNTVYLGDGQTRKFVLSNRNTDRKEEFKNKREYTLVVFGHTEGSTYRFAFDQIVDGTSYDYIEGTYFTRSFSVTVNSDHTVTNPRLYTLNSVGSYEPFSGDWALYDSYVKETGTLEVELRVRSTAQRLLPSSPKVFDNIYFGGAPQGTSFILSEKTTVRPIFTQYPSLGTTVSFEDIAAHRFTCLDVIKSIKHLFNLKFYTDELSKTVYAEPPGIFYTSNSFEDWTAKIDRSKPIVIKEPAEKTASIITYCYRSGDGSVTRQNQSRGETLGKWSVAIGNNLAKTGEQTNESPMFTASVNQSGDYPDALAASLIQAGDRNTTSSDDMEELNFLPKIVVYEGMRKLPAGQHWGWPGNENTYPYISFHHTDIDNTGTGDIKPFTLCFEDRDGLKGLHRYRDKDIAQLKSGKRIEVYMVLRPLDIEPFIRLNSMKKDFRGLFRLEINGEAALYRLEEIVGYSPSRRSSVKCIFLLEYPLS